MFLAPMDLCYVDACDGKFGETHKKAVSDQRSSVSQKRFVSRTGDVNQRHPRREAGNHKGCPYNTNNGAKGFAASWGGL